MYKHPKHYRGESSLLDPHRVKLGPESRPVAVRWVFGTAELRSAERNCSIPTLSLIQLIQQVFIPAWGVRCRGIHGCRQHCWVSPKLYSGRSLCAGGVSWGLTVTQALPAWPGSHLRPKYITACPRWRPRPSHKVQGFRPFGRTAPTWCWRKHHIWVR